MGVVIRQSFWGTAIAYVGVLVGYFNTLYLRPEFLSLDQIGLFTLVTANAMLISPFCSAGMPGTLIKYFPELKNTEGLKNQFFTLQFLIVIGLNALLLFIAYLSRDWIASFFILKSPEYVPYLIITGIIIIVNSAFDMFYAYCRVLLNVLFPTFLRDVFLRMGAILLIGGFAMHWWSFQMAVQGLAIMYLLALVILFIYLMVKYEFRFSFDFSKIDRSWKKRMISFGGYLMLLAFSLSILNNIHYAQISAILGPAANGIFTTCFFIGIVIEMPRRNMVNVISPIFSKAIQEGKMLQVDELYKKGSITMGVFGILLFIGVLTNLDDLFRFIPQGSDFQKGYWVVVAICSAKLVVMLFSFSQEILVYSKHHRFALYFQLIAALVLVISNIIFLPIWGIVGAGISYLLVTVIQSVIRYFFLKNKFQLDPFSSAHLRLILVGLIVFTLFWVTPFPFSPVVSIILRSVLTTILYVGIVYALNISPDINQLIRSTFEKVLKK